MSDPQGMAESFSKGLADAFNDALAPEGGGMVTAFVGVVKYIDADGDPRWALVSMEAQTLDLSMGMLHIATKMVDNQIAGAWGFKHG